MVITIPGFAGERQGIRHFFGTRQQGVASVFAAPGVVSVNQVHGTDVLVVDRPVSGAPPFEGGWDALVTDQAGVLLTVKTADCVPVLIHDPRARVVAAVHAGWRGAVAGIIPNTITTLQKRFGSQPASLRFSIGPAAGACCYEVDEPVLARLRESYADWRTLIKETGPGRAKLNLRGLVRGQAVNAGVPEAGIHSVSLCTICHATLFHSYRREGTVRGTMVSGIMLAPRRSARRGRGKRRAN
jgi:hypothetical protein